MNRKIWIIALIFLINVSYINNASAMDWWYKGPWFVYENVLDNHTNMHILVETDSGVDDDDNHRYLTFDHHSGCRSPSWGYTHNDIVINNHRDRRVWDIWAHELTPGCLYNLTFHYRLRYTDPWHSVTGKFLAAPRETSTEQEFYGFGDQRYRGAIKDIVEQVSSAVMSHHGKKTFILNSGDIAYMGGYHFDKHDYWHDYFRNEYTRILLNHMPMLTSPGNHDLDNGTGYDRGNAVNYTRYFPYSHVHVDPSTAYYHRKYGRVNVYSLTSYPMDTDSYCSKYNANYRPKDEGGTGQYDWLESQLADIQDDPQQWKVVMMHAPIYSPGSCNHQEDAKTYLVPLFEKYGVDMFVSGHEHYYARKTVNGIPYLILGGAGGALSLNDKCKLDEHCNGFDLVKNKHHFAYFKIKGDIMTAEVLDENKNKIEIFTVDRSPKASFDFTPEMGGPPPLAVKFTDTSMGKRNKYQWDFGDGTETDVLDGIDASTEHTYTEEGAYTVKLTIWSAYSSNVKTITNTINIWNIPDFSADPLEIETQQSVTFTDKSVGDVTKWMWDFTDGDSSTEQNPVHQYNRNGMFTVKLTINQDSVSSNTTTKTKYDYVKVKPYADFNYHTSVSCSDPCEDPINASYETIFYNKSGGDHLKYSWDFGDGTTSTEENPVHGYASIGLRAVLTVSHGVSQNSRSKYIEVGTTAGGIPSLVLVNDRLQLELNNVSYQDKNYTAILESEDGQIYSLVDGSVGNASQTSNVQAILYEEMWLYIPMVYYENKNYKMKLKYIPNAEKMTWKLVYREENDRSAY